MRTGAWAMLVLVMAACGGGGGGDDGDGDGDGDGGDELDAVAGDGALPSDGAVGVDAPSAGRSVLFQCDGTGGGICAMDADGSDRRTLNGAGFVPHGGDGGAVYFHTATYRATRRTSGGSLDDLGDGAFVRPQPDGRLLFQCAGLGGGICRMDADGSNRQTVRATGRVPDADAGGRILFHSDAYRVIRRDAGGGETDLGDGAFPTWTAGGRILFQCSGLGGGLCRMDADGGNRETVLASGRVPTGDDGGRVLFHTDAYTVSLRTGTTTTPLGAGANAVWW